MNSAMFERVVSGALALAAVAIAAVVVSREFRRVESRDVVPLPTDHQGWSKWAADGIWMGDPNAPVVVGEFVDFQCLGCKPYHFGTLRPLKEEFGQSVSWVMIHLPLASHEHSFTAGVAVECASQERLDLFIDGIFEKQDSLGTKSWASFAHDVGVADTLAFNACMLAEGPRARVARGRQIADSLGIRATPTIMVNGRVYPRPPPRDSLFQIVRGLLDSSDER